MSLTLEQLKARDGKLTASRVACLMSGDAEKVMDLWRELTGDPSWEPEDLSAVWPVQLGTITETLNLDWWERKNGRPLTRRGEVVVSPHASWAASTLDGFDASRPAVVECKHVGGFEPREKIIERYMPQVHWAMLCTDTAQCDLSIIEGARVPAIEMIALDKDYAAELWLRANTFMQCVWDLVPPVEFAPIAAPVAAVKTYDMTGNNAWSTHAGIWAENHAASKKFEGAAKELKTLVPADAVLCKGHGILVKRDKAARLSISASKEV